MLGKVLFAFDKNYQAIQYEFDSSFSISMLFATTK